MTFDEVSHPYLEILGFPDQSHEFNLENQNFIQWYYYEEDIVVEFVCSAQEDDNGWELSFAFSLDPLKYFKKER